MNKKVEIKEVMKAIEDVKNRTLNHKGPSKFLDEGLNGFAVIIFEEIIRVVKNIK